MKMRQVYRIALHISAFLGVIWVIVQLGEWLLKPRAVVLAEVEYSRFPWPPSLSKEFETIRELTDQGVLGGYLKKIDIDNREQFRIEAFATDVSLYMAEATGELKRKGIETDLEGYTKEVTTRTVELVKELRSVWAQEASYQIYSELHSQIPFSLPEKYRRVEGVWFVKIVHKGKLPVSGLEIRLPDTVLVYVEGRGSKEFRESSEIIPLGNLSPGDEIEITAWTGFGFPGFQKEGVRLSHSTGVGAVKIRERVGPFWKMAEQFIGLWIFNALLVILMIIQISMMVRRVRR